ncbi:MAG TPA: FtsW/RodA/SpoVE family cell cycle protein [Acidimicrobiia bacterium]|nr:FtsW/RodA/SpoVE family cell cycle protein [Acidimicrobiia bacterium]
MTRNVEASLIIGGAVLAAFGTTLVNLAIDGTVDAQVGLTFLIMAIAFGGFHLAVRRFAPDASPNLVPAAALVAMFGLIEIYRINPVRAGLQRWWLLIAAAGGVIVLAWLHQSGTDALRRYRNITLAGAVVLMLTPMLPSNWAFPVRGLTVNGSRLWIEIDLGFTALNFQPGEIAKVAFVVFLAGYLADRRVALIEARRRIGPLALPEPRQLLPLVVVWGATLGVMVGQRDLGASLLLFAVFVAMLYSATGQSGYLTGGAFLAVIGAVGSWRAFDHVQRRVTAWINPLSDFENAGFQVAQGMFGLGTGSLSGSGPGLGRPDLIPNAITDFIFVAVGEEFGFAGTVAVLAAYALMVAAGFGISLRARDRFRKILAAGLTLTFGIQTFLIIGGVLRVVPLTGITLPFMSYGGSSLVGNFILLAILLRVSHEEAEA